MSWSLAAVLTGITSFVATNIDDLIVLMLFFSQVNDKLLPKHIVIGQYLGFTFLIIASLPGFFGGLILPKAWIGLLGLVPIIIGIKQLLNKEENSEEIQTVSSIPFFSFSNKSLLYSLNKIINFQTYNVAAVTVANGGDNIGIYVSLFASSNLIGLAIILAVFYLLIAVWCLIAYSLTRQRVIANILANYGQAITPFVLIGLGIFIIVESGTYRLIPLFQ